MSAPAVPSGKQRGPETAVNPDEEAARALEAVRALPVEHDWRRLVPRSGKRVWGRWTHQYDAFNFVLRYLKLPRSDGQSQRPRAALIRMPTGTGKTGIMALIAGYADVEWKESTDASILIVVPSTTLRRQVAEAIRLRFWSTIVRRRPHRWRPVYEFVPSDLADAMKPAADWPGGDLPPVLVCTTTALAMLSGDIEASNATSPAPKTQDSHAEWRALYDRLLDKVGLVIVDEGHREPAPNWARAIRRFRRPTILFTATPYRNDLRLFSVGSELPSVPRVLTRPDGTTTADHGPYRFVFSYGEARRLGVIRNVRFISPMPRADWQGRGDKSADHFARALLEFYDRTLLPGVEAWTGRHRTAHLRRQPDRPLWPPKVIVRCDSFDSVVRVRRALRKLETSKRTLAIHSAYRTDDPRDGTFSEVPGFENRAAQEATFWVHQDMLVEGLDHPGFWAVAFYESFSNSRSMVQQIGRVLREPIGARGAPAALVFSPPADRLEEQWEGYKQYEEVKPPIVGPEEIVQSFLDALPDWFYSGQKYRSKVLLGGTPHDDAALWEQIRFAPAAQVWQGTLGDQELDRAAEELADVFEQHDHITIRILRPPKSVPFNARVLVGMRVCESPKLGSMNFFDVGLSLGIFYAADGFLFWQGPVGIGDVLKQWNLAPLPADVLQKTLGKDAVVKQLRTVNTDLGRAAVRQRAIGAFDLSVSGSTLADPSQVVSTVVATSAGPLGRRQAQFLRSRVADLVHHPRPVEDFVAWADGVAAQLHDQDCVGPAMLSRYAAEVTAPEDSQAAHVLIDVRPLLEMYRPHPPSPGDTDSDDGVMFEDLFEATAANVVDARFETVLGGRPLTGRIDYKRPRFSVKFDDVEGLELGLELREPGSTQKRPRTLLTGPASLRVVTSDGLLYTERRFFRPRHLWGPERSDDLVYVTGVSALSGITHGEKGEVKGPNRRVTLQLGPPGRRQSWHPASLFGMVDDVKSSIYEATDFQPKWLVCDDMGSEVADFIALDDRPGRTPRMVIMHCKMGGDGGPASTAAGDLHTVTAQATKNLGLFSLASQMLDGRVNKWSGCWKNKRSMPMIRRWPGRRNRPTGQQFLDILKAALRRGDLEREVWLVLGNSISAESVKQAAASSATPPAHQIHLLYILHALRANAAVLQIGVRVLTRPRSTDSKNVDGRGTASLALDNFANRQGPRPRPGRSQQQSSLGQRRPAAAGSPRPWPQPRPRDELGRCAAKPRPGRSVVNEVDAPDPIGAGDPPPAGAKQGWAGPTLLTAPPGTPLFGILHDQAVEGRTATDSGHQAESRFRIFSTAIAFRQVLSVNGREAEWQDPNMQPSRVSHPQVRATFRDGKRPSGTEAIGTVG